MRTAICNKCGGRKSQILNGNGKQKGGMIDIPLRAWPERMQQNTHETPAQKAISGVLSVIEDIL
jgi:hypothetical protein